jgi:AraC-like DNA-binding protein
MFGEKWKNWQTEQYMITIIIQIIRLCAGPKWLPPDVKISSSHKALPFPEEWKNIRFVWGSDTTDIKIPEKILAQPLSKQATKKTSGFNKSTKPVPCTPLNFTELVRTQILTNSLGIENAAQQTGISPKTLKRKLLQDNTSYSEIVEQLRFELAQSKLKNLEAPIHTIARELGYEHHANFTRAFKRMSGITPQEYRKQLVR